MLSTERPEAEKIFAALLAGFDRKATTERLEAYWRGCNRMALPLLDRIVNHALSEEGPEEVPSPKRLWTIARDLRAPSAVNDVRVHADYDDAHALGQGTLLAFLRHQGGATSASLARLIQVKAKLVEGFRSMPKHERDDPGVRREWIEIAFEAFAKHWQQRTAQEIALDRDHYARTGRMRDESAAATSGHTADLLGAAS